MNEISFYIISQEFSNPLTVLAVNKNTPNGPVAKAADSALFFFSFLFYKIVVLFHSSLSLSTIKYQLFSGVKFGFLYLCKTKLGHSLL